MHFKYYKFKSGHRMGIYYCCDIYAGGIGDTLNYAQRLLPKGYSPRTQQLYNSPPPKLSYLPHPNHI